MRKGVQPDHAFDAVYTMFYADRGFPQHDPFINLIINCFGITIPSATNGFYV